MTGEDLGLGQVRGQHRGLRHQQALQGADRAFLDQRRATLRDHDRIEDERDTRGALGDDRRDGLDDGRVVQHAGLQRISAKIVEHDLDLLPDEIGRDRQDAEHACCVLRGQRRHGGHRKAAEHRHGFDVRLDAGAAAGIRAGDDQYPPVHPGFIAASTGIIPRPAPAI